MTVTCAKTLILPLCLLALLTLLFLPLNVMFAADDGRVNDGGANDGEGPVPVEKSMHEFMEYVFQPTYKRLKASMHSEDKDRSVWKAVKSDALILAEGGNLLLMRAPDKDGESWKSLSRSVRAHGGELYAAAKKQDGAAADKAYRAMLVHCNRCHQQFAKGKYQLEP